MQEGVTKRLFYSFLFILLIKENEQRILKDLPSLNRTIFFIAQESLLCEFLLAYGFVTSQVKEG